MKEEERRLIEDYTEYIMMGLDESFIMSVNHVKDNDDKKKIMMIHEMVTASVVSNMEAYFNFQHYKEMREKEMNRDPNNDCCGKCLFFNGGTEDGNTQFCDEREEFVRKESYCYRFRPKEQE